MSLEKNISLHVDVFFHILNILLFVLSHHFNLYLYIYLKVCLKGDANYLFIMYNFLTMGEKQFI